MSKQKISAKDLIADLRAGMDDPALMKKYGLSAQGLQSAFKKLVEAKALKQSELENRVPLAEKTVDLVWKCPACGKPQTREFDECPECGIIVSKLKDAIAKAASNVGSLPEDQIGRLPSFFNAHRVELVLILCGLLVVIIIAGFWIKAVRDREVEAVRAEAIRSEKQLRAKEAKEQQLKAQEEKQLRAREAREQQLLEKVSNIEKMEDQKRKDREEKKALEQFRREDKLRTIFMDTVKLYMKGRGYSFDEALGFVIDKYRQDNMEVPEEILRQAQRMGIRK